MLQVAIPYDWRLPITVMESRDGYFTRVKTQVELQHRLSRGIKPVMVSHSYGVVVSMAFFKWVEKVEPGWVDKYLHGYVNLAGPSLGLPKAISPLLSGTSQCKQRQPHQFILSVQLLIHVPDWSLSIPLPGHLLLWCPCQTWLPPLPLPAAGETRETVDIVAGLAVLVEQYLGKQSRAGVSVASSASGFVL
jgi:hypothetical protein